MAEKNTAVKVAEVATPPPIGSASLYTPEYHDTNISATFPGRRTGATLPDHHRGTAGLGIFPLPGDHGSFCQCSVAPALLMDADGLGAMAKRSAAMPVLWEKTCPRLGLGHGTPRIH